MKVDIAELRKQINGEQRDIAYCQYELNEALNELETRRLASNEQEALREENRRLRNDLARVTAIKDNLIIAGDRMRAELNNRSETTSFKKWFKNLHPETIESITFNLRKKEN